jgi:hypothetical protein
MFSVSLFAGEEGDGEGVNSTNMGLSIYGAAGYGQSLFGVIENSDDRGDLGVGPGGSFGFGALFNYSILAIEADFTQAYYNDTELKQNGETIKTDGEGYFRTLEILAGLKLFTEEDDMGYTLLYAGYKTWKVDRKVDSATVNGIADIDFKTDYEVEGDGWIAGYRDLSTFDVSAFSIAFQTGLWYQHLPVSSLKSNGNKIDLKKDASAGLGFEIGLGAAFEDLGLSVMLSAEVDVTATILKDASNEEVIVGAGYAQYFLTVTKDFSI